MTTSQYSLYERSSGEVAGVYETRAEAREALDSIGVPESYAYRIRLATADEIAAAKRGGQKLLRRSMPGVRDGGRARPSRDRR